MEVQGMDELVYFSLYPKGLVLGKSERQ